MLAHARQWAVRNFAWANISAGATVGAFLIPQAMAYGELAGVGVAIGLSVAAIPMLVYPIIGRHRWLSMGPESAVALMAAATAGPLAAEYGINPLTVLSLLAIATGAILLIARACSAAVVTDLLSKPVLTGYLTGIAILMILSQIGNATGQDIDSSSLITIMQTADIGHVNWYSAAICIAGIAIVLLLRRRWRKFPGLLLVLLLAIPVGALLPVETIGAVTPQLPALTLPPLHADFILPLLTGAGAIAIVAYTDTIATARSINDGTPVSPERELTALGISQIAVGSLGGYPVSASSTRTAIARDSGATTRFYSYTSAAVAIAGPLLLAGVIGGIPKAALGAVVLLAAAGLVDVRAWKELKRLRLAEVGVGIACTLGVLLLGILPGILLAVTLSIAELLVRLARPHDAILGVVPGVAGMHDVDDYPDAQTIPGLVVFRYDAPLFFANANNFYDACLEAAGTQGCQWLILNVESNVEVDSTGLDALRELHDALQENGQVLALARVKNDLLEPLRRYGIAETIGEDRLYPTLPVAVQAYLDWKNDSQHAEPMPLPTVSPVHRFARVEHRHEHKEPRRGRGAHGADQPAISTNGTSEERREQGGQQVGPEAETRGAD